MHILRYLKAHSWLLTRGSSYSYSIHTILLLNNDGLSPPRTPIKSLLISVRVAHDPISRGSEQTVFVKVSDKSNSKPVPDANVKGF